MGDCNFLNRDYVDEDSYNYINQPRVVSVESWKMILQKELDTRKDHFDFIGTVLTEVYYAHNQTVFCSDLEKKLGIFGLNLRIGEFGKRIIDYNIVDIKEQFRSDSSKQRFWNIPFYTDETINDLSENKGYFSWVLRDELAQAMEELNIVGKRNKVLFCNIAYMQYYDFFLCREKPVNGGQYIDDTGDALEKYNFHKCRDGVVRGFVETKYVGGYGSINRVPKQLHIENIDCAYKNAEFIDNVTVVFCAKNPNKNINKTVIVGWYKNAKVYRHRNEYLNRVYNIEAKFDDIVLLPEDKRIFEIPRAQLNAEKIGFGQSNIWYANKQNHVNFVKQVIKYIHEYSNIKHKNSEIEVICFNDYDLNEALTQHRFSGNEKFEYTNELVLKKLAKTKSDGQIVYQRDRRCANNAIIHARHTCEIDCNHKSFQRRSDGFPYMEAHHLIPMAQQELFEYSLDVEENIVSLCSNCHKEIHYGKNANQLIEKLYYERQELLKKKKICVSLEKLLSFYNY